MNKTTASSTGGIAIISDVHGNLDALGAVLRDIVAQQCFAIFCLGDTIGYGPEPGECLRLVKEYAQISLMGNHEAMFLMARDPANRAHLDELGELAPSIELGCKQLTDDETRWVEDLPLVAPVGEMELVHGSLLEPETFGYLLNESLAREHFSKQTQRVSFYGHTHLPMVWKDGKRITGKAGGSRSFELEIGERYAIGVGSVGQPRDNDPRACYVVYRPASDLIEFRRVEYDIKRAQARFKAAGLPAFHRERIAKGE